VSGGTPRKIARRFNAGNTIRTDWSPKGTAETPRPVSFCSVVPSGLCSRYRYPGVENAGYSRHVLRDTPRSSTRSVSSDLHLRPPTSDLGPFPSSTASGSLEQLSGQSPSNAVASPADCALRPARQAAKGRRRRASEVRALDLGVPRHGRWQPPPMASRNARSA